MHAVRLAAVVVSALFLAGCGSGTRPVMPDVVGKQLDVAKSDIQRAGIGSKVEVLGGGLLGILDESNWEVCEQLPDAGDPVEGSPRLTVGRACGEEADPGAEPSETAAATPSATSTLTTPDEQSFDEAEVKDTTVDKLLNKLNSMKTKEGELYRFTGELFMSELWGRGVTGDYSVMFKAQNGAQDLPAFVDESMTADWENGTVVEVVVEDVEMTVGDDTSNGWLWIRSAKKIS